MKIIFIEIFSIALLIAFVIISIFYIRMRMTLHFLLRQLEEIEDGSHMEFVIESRQRPLIALCRELNHVLTQKDDAHIQYERAEKQMKQNVTALAHDIRTPLTGASGYVQLAKECGDADKRKRYLTAAQKRLVDLEDMLEEMFLYTKLTGEEFTLSRKTIQVLPLLGDSLLGLYARFEEKGTAPEVNFASENFSICGDEEALRRIFQNLLQNFLVHGAGELVITQKESRLIFENDLPEGVVLNTEQIFDRFYKGENARRKGSSGLGLFIVKELMKRMEGDAGAHVEAGRLQITLFFADR